MDVVLIGAGGHAKAVVEAILGRGDRLTAYVDPRPAPWLDARHFEQDCDALAELSGAVFAIGLGGVEPADLKRRLALYEQYRAAGFAAPAVVHPAAHVSPSAELEDGAIVLAAAVVQPGASVGTAAIVNTGASVEHDSEIGPGSHVAPGAILLGECRIGRCSMIGAGALVLPETHVPDETLVPALSRHKA
ncbi:MAG: hypothetical protein V3U23_05465 [Kiloniellales bacterium]